MSDLKWRFPASNHGERKGISSGDTEIFKKSPVQAFAREVLQNSIDARASDEEPTVVEFNEFQIKTDDVPGINELRDAMRRCMEFWEHKEDYVKEYQEMLDVLKQATIKCLRISDYNTTGLIGVDSTNPVENKFLALTKGTGVSEKNGNMAGGSKGVGKNAVFLMSSVRTAFYSTNANQNIHKESGSFKGAIGVAELVSGYVDDKVCENRDYTQGTGYFSKDDLHSALSDVIALDKPQRNRNNEFGTDIYILGFIGGDEWEKEVLNSILDSFMPTIVRGHLEVNINQIEISKDTIRDIVYDDSLIYRNQRANIISQYRLLTDDDNVKIYDIDTEYGTCELRILPYSKEEDLLATHKCSMIRYPLMKIRDQKIGSSFRVSAMCIIGEGKLGEALRNIENSQHIDWEPNRIKDKSIKNEMLNLLRDINTQINEKIIECLQIGDENPLDPNGAGDYLPDANFGDGKLDSNGNQIPSEAVSVSKIKENINIEKLTRVKNDNGSGLEPDIGEVDDNIDGIVQHPIGENDNNGQGRHPGSEESGEKEGDNIIYKRAKLSGVKYKVISLDKSQGKIRIVFIAPIDKDNCYLCINMLDDMNNATPIKIYTMKCNGVDINSSDSVEYGPFKIVTNQKITLDVITEAKGFFGSEVKVICK